MLLDGIALPARSSKVTDFDSIGVGQTLLIENADAKVVKSTQGSLTNYKKRTNRKFKTTTLMAQIPGIPDGVTYPALAIQRVE